MAQRAIIIFDRQHYGKPGKNDQGAGFDIDDDGVVETQERETQLTPLYYLPAKAMLEALGHRVVVLDQGWYSHRHKQANQIARDNPGVPVAYIACHINAGRGSYSALIHDSQSTGGAVLARALGDALTLATLQGIDRVRVVQGSPTNGWKRGYTTIKGIYAGPSNISGVCFEPYFIDNAAHHNLTTEAGSAQIAKALVGGLRGWLRGWPQ